MYITDCVFWARFGHVRACHLSFSWKRTSSLVNQTGQLLELTIDFIKGMFKLHLDTINLDVDVHFVAKTHCLELAVSTSSNNGVHQSNKC